MIVFSAVQPTKSAVFENLDLVGFSSSNVVKDKLLRIIALFFRLCGVVQKKVPLNLPYTPHKSDFLIRCRINHGQSLRRDIRANCTHNTWGVYNHLIFKVIYPVVQQRNKKSTPANQFHYYLCFLSWQISNKYKKAPSLTGLLSISSILEHHCHINLILNQD